jgi:starch phosphorylase
MGHFEAVRMNDRTIAYFSMEIALDPAMPTYSGGLGVLAGDTIRSAADLKVPMVAISLLHRKGYPSQRLDASGWQHEEPTEWAVGKFLQELPQRAQVTIQRRTIHVRAWWYEVKGFGNFTVPVFLLDTDLPENSEWERTLTHHLYGGDQLYRLCQEVVLGIGGTRMLRALGFHQLAHFHMNEGHAALLTLELLSERSKQAGRECVNHEDIEAVRQQCIFTTHTPVPAGHDQFPMDLVADVLGHRADFLDMKDLFCANLVNEVLGQRRAFANFKDVLQSGQSLNMTFLALNLSHYVNGVAKKHGEVSRHMFGGYEIDAITNGVHAATWVSPPFQALFDKHISGWRQDNFSLRFAHGLSRAEIWQAHVEAKQQLFEFVSRTTRTDLDPGAMTLGFARRATRYKRGDLLVRDLVRLRDIAARAGKFQIIYAGKAHPNDSQGKEFIQRIVQVRDALMPAIPIVYLENYDIEMAKLLTAGVDVWLNTPQPPMEASGTSGMKAALNGVPSLSILDGWWIEGWIEGQTGWAIGENCEPEPNGSDRSACDAASLYDKLERVILPLYHRNRDGFVDVMRHCISLNGSFFNTQRMVQQYVVKAYLT